MKKLLPCTLLVLITLVFINGHKHSCWAFSPFDDSPIVINNGVSRPDTAFLSGEKSLATSKKNSSSFWSKLAPKIKGTFNKAKENVSDGYGNEASTVNKKLPKYIVESIFLPGHESKEMVCQGIAYLPSQLVDAHEQKGPCDYILLSYYPKASGQPSQIIVIDKNSRKAVRRFSLYKKSGKAYNGHAGGIAVAGKYLWVASGNKIYAFSAQEILDFIAAKATLPEAVSGLPKSFDKLPAKKLTCVKTYEVDSKASYLSFDGKYLWVGDFSKASYNKYAPVKHHGILGRNCWIAGYLVDSEGMPTSTKKYVYTSKGKKYSAYKPDGLIAMRESVQGMAICGDYAALSLSFGAANSKLAIYKNPLKTKGTKVSYKPSSQSEAIFVEAWELTDKNWLKTVKLAAGSEDLEYDGSSLYVTFECSSKNYNKKWKKTNPTVKMTEDFYLIDPIKIVEAKKRLN